MNAWAIAMKLLASLVNYITTAPTGTEALRRAERAFKAAASEQASEATLRELLK